MTNPVLDRTVTQRGNYLTVQKTGYACFRNELFDATLTESDLKALSAIISSEVKCAFSEGWEAAQQTCIKTFCADWENPNWFDKLPGNPPSED